MEHKTQEKFNQVTYVLTVRGHYRPPPYQQLGSVVEVSINRDSQKLALALKDREALPDIVAQDVEAKWLTMKEKPGTAIEPGLEIIDAGGFVFVKSWAFILVACLAGLLILLCMGMCLCLCRRARAIRSASEQPPRTEERKEARKAVKLVESMNTDDILKELESHGIAAPNSMSRTKLEDELIQARFDASYSSRKREVMFTPPTTPQEGGDTPAEVKPPNEPKGGKPRGVFRFLQWLLSTNEDKEPQRREVRLVESMSVGDIRDELESYGVSPPDVLEGRKKLEEELIQARFDNVYSRNGPEKRKKVTFAFTTIFSSAASSNSKDTLKTTPPMTPWAATWAVPRNSKQHEKTEEDRRRQIDGAMKDCESLKVWELRRMLKSMGARSVGFVEKKELVRAVAEARVNGTKTGTTEKDVEAQLQSPSPGRSVIHTWGARLGNRKGDKTSGSNIAQPGAKKQRRHSSPGPAPILRTPSGAAQYPQRPRSNSVQPLYAEPEYKPHPIRREKSKREPVRRWSLPGPSYMHTPGGVDHSPPWPRSRSAQPYPYAYVDEQGPLFPKETHSREPMQPHSRSTYQPRHLEQIHRASTRTQTRPRSDARRRSPEKSSRHQGAKERDPDRYARRHRRCEERDVRAQAQAHTQATPRARTRSADDRRDGSRWPGPEEPRTSRSCPTNAYAGGWDEAAYYSQFQHLGGQRNDNETHRSRSAPKPYSEEHNARAKACAKARPRSEENPPARKRSAKRRGKRRHGGNPRRKDSRRDQSGRRARRPSCEIDGLFGDEYAFQIV